jgi:hypothetical protein
MMQQRPFRRCHHQLADGGKKIGQKAVANRWKVDHGHVVGRTRRGRGTKYALYIVAMAKSGKPERSLATAPLPIPLSEQDRAGVIAALEKLPIGLRGNDVSLLVDYVEEALNPAPTEYRLLGFDAVSYAAQEDARKEIAKRLDKVVGMARDLAQIMLPERDTAEYEAIAEAQPWVRSLDPFVAAVGPRLYRDRVQHPPAKLGDVRRAIRLIASLPSAPSGERGRPYDAGPGSGLVRAVCLYRHKQQLAVSLSWPIERTDGPAAVDRLEPRARGGGRRRIGDDLLVLSDTSELIVAVANAFRLPTDKTSLRSHLHNYRDELAALERGEPTETDLYGSLFDANPRTSRRKPAS